MKPHRTTQVRTSRQNHFEIERLIRDAEIPLTYSECANMALGYGLPVLRKKLPMKQHADNTPHHD